MKRLGLLICCLLVMATNVTLAADPQPLQQPASTDKPAHDVVLTPLSAQVIKGEMMVIASNQDRAFDSQAANNEVSFEGKGNSTIRVKASAVSPDGRVLTVRAPDKALSGMATIKNGAKDIGKVAVGIVDSPCIGGWFFQIMAMLPTVVFLIFLTVVKKALKDGKWNLSDALSETDALRDNAGALEKNPDTGNPIYPKSASRLIAFIGLFVIVIWIMGLSIPTFYHFACTGEMPDLSGVSTFLAAQAGLFAPYIANKIAGAIK